MDDFTISLADIPISIQPLCREIRPFFEEYLSSEAPCFVVSPGEKDLEYERIMSEKMYGKLPAHTPWPATYLEITALLRLIADRILEYNAVLFHGSAIAVDGRGYLFAAPSGTGKTTHTRFWLQQLPQAYVLNGDKPFLKISENDQILVCGTPWQGKEKLGCNKILPLEAICLLERSTENHICSITPKMASQSLLRQVHLPEGAAFLRGIQLLDKISKGVHLFRLGCNMNPEAANVSIRAMIPAYSAENMGKPE